MTYIEAGRQRDADGNLLVMEYGSDGQLYERFIGSTVRRPVSTVPPPLPGHETLPPWRFTPGGVVVK